MYKTSGGHRRYLKSDPEKLIGMEVEETNISVKNIFVIYAFADTVYGCHVTSISGKKY